MSAANDRPNRNLPAPEPIHPEAPALNTPVAAEGNDWHASGLMRETDRFNALVSPTLDAGGGTIGFWLRDNRWGGNSVRWLNVNMDPASARRFAEQLLRNVVLVESHRAETKRPETSSQGGQDSAGAQQEA